MRSPPSALLRSPPPTLLRRPLVIRVIAVAIVVVLGIAAFALPRLRLPVNRPTTLNTNLAAPLPIEAEADLAETMPAIDELRHRRGSVLQGTLLEETTANQALAENSYTDLLRREARRLDALAAEHEDGDRYAQADGLRIEAEHLRQFAREVERTGLPDTTYFECKLR